ncbi:hypothetical protein NBG77_06030 [Proteus terrae]|uniref:hypothetical protein n=1 Tax=Proteus terrae TaxID=1574161 RepID=UPI0021BA8E1A|nr:hypothetical protein [Proteus terrae]MCT8263030.1 hypothetical protein [Proteus terrae]
MEEQALKEWCVYVLSGISVELKKLEKLTNHTFLSKKILYPAIDFSLERELINTFESKVLK